MSDWISTDTTRYSAMGTVELNNSRGTLIKSGGVNTKGSYGLLIQSTPFDADLFGIHIGPGDTVATGLVDISIGPKDSETVLLENLAVDMTTAAARMYPYLFPISVPRGTRISARLQSSDASGGFNIAGFFAGGGFADNAPRGKVRTYGAVTSTSRGTSIDPGATANTKGAWVQITDSTTAPTIALYLTIEGQANDIRTDCDWLIDIGVGSAGNEQVIIQNIPVDCLDNGDTINPRVVGPFSVSIPTGSRLAVRAQCSITDATDRLFGALLYGVN